MEVFGGSAVPLSYLYRSVLFSIKATVTHILAGVPYLVPKSDTSTPTPFKEAQKKDEKYILIFVNTTKNKNGLTCPGGVLTRVKCMNIKNFSLLEINPAWPTGKTFGATGGIVRHKDMLHFRLFWAICSGWTSNLISCMRFFNASVGEFKRRQNPSKAFGRYGGATT